MHHFHRFSPGYGIYDGNLDCYDMYYLYPNNQLPPYCS
jgi:hypothetical protein